MSKKGAFDAHRHNIQRFMAGVGNRDKKFNRKEEKQMRRILAEVEVPDGKYCVTDDGVICEYLSNFWRLKEQEKYCELFKCDLKALAFAGTVPVKCNKCMTAGRVMGGYVTGTTLLSSDSAPTCTLDGDCDG